jgi:UDP-N-acetylmuramate--alanine ligase
MTALIQIIEEQKKLGLLDPRLKISKSDLSYKTNDPLTEDIDLAVVSTAIPANDADYAALKQRGVKFWHRSDMLCCLSEPFKQIVISGTHGKTTCSAMVAHILSYAGLDPSYAVGGILSNYNINGKAGRGEYFVLEGDESDKSFLKSKPYIAQISYVEPDHLENYPGGFEEIQNSFLSFLDRSPYKVVCIDDPVLYEYAKNHDAGNLLSYSTKHPEANFYLDLGKKTLHINCPQTINGQKPIKTALAINLAMQGSHNLINAAGAIASSYIAGVAVGQAVAALAEFRGIKRRFELINASYVNSHAKNICVYDDYAHHPTEVEALIAGALSLKPKRLVFVYQPHHPERTKQLWQDFVKVFKDFPEGHLALIADVYVARSKHIAGIDTKRLVADINKSNVKYQAPHAEAIDVQGNYSDMIAALKPGIDEVLCDDDLLLIVGAGNIAKIVPAFS